MHSVFLAVPPWVWATLLMIAFVAVSALTMWFARYALREPTARSPGEIANRDDGPRPEDDARGG